MHSFDILETQRESYKNTTTIKQLVVSYDLISFIILTILHFWFMKELAQAKNIVPFKFKFPMFVDSE